MIGGTLYIDGTAQTLAAIYMNYFLVSASSTPDNLVLYSYNY